MSTTESDKASPRAPLCLLLAENKGFALSELKPEFHTKLDGLREYLGGVLTNPHKFGGRDVVGGMMLQPLVANLCAAVSECKAVKPLRYHRPTQYVEWLR